MLVEANFERAAANNGFMAVEGGSGTHLIPLEEDHFQLHDCLHDEGLLEEQRQKDLEHRNSLYISFLIHF